jgi:large subunit ribosomal protein L27
MGKDHTIFALIEGRVRFASGRLGRTFISVDPASNVPAPAQAAE